MEWTFGDYSVGIDWMCIKNIDKNIRQIGFIAWKLQIMPIINEMLNYILSNQKNVSQSSQYVTVYKHYAKQLLNGWQIAAVVII